jgi:hypothetical protein
MSSVTGRIFVMGSALLLALGAVGCRDEGPAERAGRAIDEAVDDAGNQMDEAMDHAKDTMDDAKKKMEDMGD